MFRKGVMFNKHTESDISESFNLNGINVKFLAFKILIEDAKALKHLGKFYFVVVDSVRV
jgi:hypothetical protein